MLIMGAHEMVTTGATAAGTVADTYEADSLVNGDPHDPIRTDDGSATFTVTGVASLDVDGIVLANHNLDAGITVDFGIFGPVVTPAIPPGGIRLNAWAQLTTPVAGADFTLSLSGNSTDVIIAAAIAGVFHAVQTLPASPTFQFKGYGIPHPGEFGGLAYAKGGESRSYGGRVLLYDTDAAVLLSCYRASEENSLPTVIVPKPEETDPTSPLYGAWVVTWDTFEPQPIQPADEGQEGLWGVNVLWREIARLKWPA